MHYRNIVSRGHQMAKRASGVIAAHGRNLAAKAAAVGTLGTMAMANAYAADDDLGTTALSAVSGLKSSVNGILLVLIGVVFLLVLFSYLKRAK